jgi:alkaline phosphatase D
MARADPRLGGEEQFWTDAWDGYPAARTRLLTGLRDRDARSCVVISGDSHATFACDLRQDAGNEDSPIVATEVCGTSITSQGRPASQIETLLQENPDIHYADASRRGYTVLDITPGETRVAARVLDDASVRSAAVSTARTFTIARDRPGIQL